MDKLEITPLDNSGNRQTDQRFTVLFNPTTYSVSKSVNWTAAAGRADAPTLSFNGGNSRVLSLELFYDVTEMVMQSGVPQFVDDVRQETGRMVALTRMQTGNKPPPTIEVSWGGAGPILSDFPFVGVITSLSQNFTLFSNDGKPLRATLGVSITEFQIRAAGGDTDAGTATSIVAASSDRLDALAATHYGNPSQWRVLAAANNVNDPRRLPVGQILTIPAR